MAEVKISTDPTNNNKRMIIEISDQFDPYNNKSAIREAILEAVKLFAREWIEENRDKLMARMNVDGMANMIMLEIAKDIKREVRSDSK